MSLEFIGTTFGLQDQWGPQEKKVIRLVQNQINNHFGFQINLLINLTWFGPQFNNNLYAKVMEIIDAGKTVDNLFWLASVDPISCSKELMNDIGKKLQAKNIYKIGGFENSDQAFIFSTLPTIEDFKHYDQDSLLLKDCEHLYLCYNRKPKPHRIQLVKKICDENLHDYGIVTLGKDDVDYDVTQGIQTDLYFKIDENLDDYSYQNKFFVHKNFGGVPYDLLSLGRLDIWQSHFLNIVSETEFLPWDNMFITEKTWKPIIGLRPFVINGQTKIYQYLRKNGFRTFTHLFGDIDLENVNEIELHDSIVSAIKFLSALSKKQVKELYDSILPDLIYNHHRFFEFAKEQQHKLHHLF